MTPLRLCAYASLALFCARGPLAFSQPSRSSFASERQYAGLLQAAREAGSVPVIVQLDGALQDATNKRLRSASIAGLQAQVLDDIGDVRRVRAYRHIPYLALEATEAALQALFESRHVVSVQKDEIFEPLLVETIVSTGAETAWSYGGSGAGQSVAVIDTGVDGDHEFLAGKIVSEACFSTNYTSTSSNFRSISLCPGDTDEAFGAGAAIHCDASISGCDHGTRVAGIVAGRSDEMSGIARDANLVAIQVFSQFEDYCGVETCVRSWVSDQVAALDYVYSVHDSLQIAAVNLSLGGGHYTTEESCDEVNPAMRSVIDMLHQEGVAVIAAAGNSGLSDGLVAPACISNAISVGATTKYDAVSSFSSSAEFLDLLAPGQGVVTSIPGGGYASATGTSFSAPHAAGAWAILRSKSPDATIEELLEALQTTGYSITDERNGVVTPRIQVDAALQKALLPVELVAFDAVVSDGMVELSWETASETNNAGFEIEHSVDGRFEALEFVRGGGTRHTPAQYSFRAARLAPGWHYFRLKQIDFDGFITFSPEIKVFVDLAGAFHMGGAYPNPFNPTTQFTLTLARTQQVRIEVYDLIGKQVALLEDDVLDAEKVHQYTLDGSRLASGIYLIRAVGESFTSTRSVTLLK